MNRSTDLPPIGPSRQYRPFTVIPNMNTSLVACFPRQDRPEGSRPIQWISDGKDHWPVHLEFPIVAWLTFTDEYMGHMEPLFIAPGYPTAVDLKTWLILDEQGYKEDDMQIMERPARN